MNRAGPNPEREPTAVKTAAIVWTAIKAVATVWPVSGFKLLGSIQSSSESNSYPV